MSAMFKKYSSDSDDALFHLLWSTMYENDDVYGIESPETRAADMSDDDIRRAVFMLKKALKTVDDALVTRGLDYPNTDPTPTSIWQSTYNPNCTQ